MTQNVMVTSGVLLSISIGATVREIAQILSPTCDDCERCRPAPPNDFASDVSIASRLSCQLEV
jgi:hypothetical protein